MNITIIIPAYKPDDKLVELVQSLSAQGLRTIVVDDGSGENHSRFFDAAQQSGATILRHDANKGKGRAIKTALEYLLNESTSSAAKTDNAVITDSAVIADADGQHAVCDILRVAQAQRDYPTSVILGVRPLGKMPLRSKLGNSFAKLLFQMKTGLNISDTQTGLRSIPSFLFPAMASLSGERYEYEMNMLLELKRLNIPFLEIPIDAIYLDNNRSSHFRPLRDTARILRQFFMFSASALLCAAIDYALFSSIIALQIIPGCAYALARIASGFSNFTLNRKVFQSKPDSSALIKYAALALANMLIGAIYVQSFQTNTANPILLKASIDVILFFANFIIQKQVIFTNKASIRKTGKVYAD